MIRPLRRAHRVIWTLLAIALPAGYLIALQARPGAPLSAAPAAAAGPGAPVGEVHGLLDDVGVRARVWTGDDGPVLELWPARDLQRPDVLVYWSPIAAHDALPERAHLIGRLAGTQRRRMSLPRNAAARDGHVYLYSLGHQALVASGPLPATAP